MINLSNTEKTFLTNYRPADKYFTSKGEMSLIADKLSLDKYTAKELVELRNAVVLFYSKLQNAEVLYDKDWQYAGRTDKFWDFAMAMGSVTTAIDYFRMGQ